MRRILLLAGAGEARLIAEGLATAGFDAEASIEGSARMAASFAVPCRTGPFGGDAGFERYLRDEDIGAVLDATHPFAARVSNRTARICAERGLPYAMFLRPAWEPEAGDNWVDLAAEAGAAKHVPCGATVFLATGRATLTEFANLQGCDVIARQIESVEGDFPFEGGRFLVGHPPFTVEGERALFKQLGVDWLILRNAGGEAPRAKLIAARELGLRVGMIRRPNLPQAKVLPTVEIAMEWAFAL